MKWIENDDPSRVCGATALDGRIDFDRSAEFLAARGNGQGMQSLDVAGAFFRTSVLFGAGQDEECSGSRIDDRSGSNADFRRDQ